MSPRQRTTRASQPQGRPVTFRGPPHRMSSLVALPEGPDELWEARALLEGAEIRGLSVRRAREGLDMGKVTLRLSKSTPPGSYSGSVEIGGKPLPIVVEVEPRPRVEASPSRLSFEVEPGTEVTADVTLLNIGNVPCEVPAASTFCVFDGSGVDHAFWVALVSDPPEGKARMDLLLDDLAESHGGLVEVRARADERTIAPGESCDVQVTLRFSDRIRPGHAYAGAWDAEGFHLRVRVSVPAKKARRRAAEEAR
jgi:hypothetical protein